MKRRNTPAKTLGDCLSRPLGKRLFSMIRLMLASLSLGLLVWLASGIPAYGAGAAVLGFVALWLLTRRKKPRGHLLLSADKQGFMRDLRLSDKTAVFDGNNIYHFGLKHKIGATPLCALVQSLRAEGYRIVCFFDANIYFTLQKNGDLDGTGSHHSIDTLKQLFGLQPDEIYIVPSGHQADAFIIETLSHLPISFAVTNDRFRDYHGRHRFLSQNHDWRKGIIIKNGEIHLYQHKFKQALRV